MSWGSLAAFSRRGKWTSCAIWRRTRALSDQQGLIDTFIGDAVEAREIDLIAVVGKNEPVRVFELLCPAGGLSPLQEKGFAAFVGGLAGYRAGDWSKAEEGFQLCLQQLLEDPPAQVFLQRLASFRDTPPDGDWDGVWRVTSK